MKCRRKCKVVLRREQGAKGLFQAGLAPGRGDLLAIGLSAILLRVGVFLTLTVGQGFSFKAYADGGDGISYQAYARAILGDESQFTEYDSRVFPGYPALIAAGHVVFHASIPVTALAITWTSAALAAVLTAVFFRDRRIGWAMVMLPPHWPINSSLMMSEAPMLAVTLGGLMLGQIKFDAVFSSVMSLVVAGLLLGLAVLIRPVAIFPLVGSVGAQWRSKNRRGALLTLLAAGVVISVGLAMVRALTGDAFHSFNIYTHSAGAYAGRVFDWPFQSLIQTPLRAHVGAGRVMYVYAHVAILLAACFILFRRVRPLKSAGALDVIALCWLGGNTLFTLCIGSGPYGWGFFHFPRFILPALPPMFWIIACLLPARNWVWGVLIVILFGVAVAGVHDALSSGPLPRVFGQ